MKKRPPLLTCMAAALSLLLLVSLLPVLRIAKYNLPSNDDLEFIETTGPVWEETHSLSETLKTAAAHTRWKMDTWQGTYSAQFLMALQPGLFGLSYYALTPYLLIGLLILSLFLFYDCVCRKFLGTDRVTPLILSLVTVFCCIQFPPSAGQGFLWFNGGVFYTAYFSLTLILFTLLLTIYQSASRKARILLTLLACALSAFIAGGNYTSMLPAAILLLTLTLAAFIQKKRGAALALTLTLLIFLIGMGINVTAPGNAKRVAFELAYYGTRQTPPVKAILLSLLYGVSAILYRFDGAMLLIILLTAALLGPYLYQSRYTFRRPLLVLLFTVGVFCSGFTATIYAGSTAGPLRSLNIVYFSELLLVGFNTAYITGFFLKKAGRPPQLLPAAVKRPLLTCAVCALLLLAGALRYGLANTTSVRAYQELTRGVARDHYQAQLSYLQTGVPPAANAASVLLGRD